jgi:hypothetical protein
LSVQLECNRLRIQALAPENRIQPDNLVLGEFA